MKKIIFACLILGVTLASCSKNDPTPEVDQEELGTVTLKFTPVKVVVNNGTTTYEPILDEEVEEVKFTGNPLLPPVGAHVHLHVGDTYKLELKTTDFAGRESQQTFVNRPEIHQAFILNAPQGSLDYVYGEPTNVGVTGYLTVKQTTDSFPLRYVLRHLNPGVKSKIKASDWNNLNFTQFTGENDIDVKFDVHLVNGGHDHDAH
ncbi:hypothetical protein ACL9RF_07190 [Sphingobacterium sp. Mn56C]|uniref:hypothetical protein n=1 Tax=Sphingobacterium sp. Mn56C TaxID=3395261 RepID=UPI003BEB5C87